MDLTVLERIGLGSSEAKAYAALIALGRSPAAAIAAQAVLNRSNCYEALNRLSKKGLITHIEQGRKTIFQAASPEALFAILKRTEEELQQLVPQLAAQQAIPESRAEIIEGYEGIKGIFEDILKTLKKDDEYIVFGATDVPPTFERFLTHWTQRRIKKGINLKIIYREDAKYFIRQTKGQERSEFKVLPKKYMTPAAVNVYDDTTVTIVWTARPIAFKVKNTEYTKSFRSYFTLLWNQAKAL